MIFAKKKPEDYERILTNGSLLSFYGVFGHKLVGVKRDTAHWIVLRARWIEIEPVCQCCGKNYNLQVHHIKPVHLYPELELDEGNLITLCEYRGFPCHFIIGHLGNWMAWNPEVRKLAQHYKDDTIVNKLFRRQQQPPPEEKEEKEVETE